MGKDREEIWKDAGRKERKDTEEKSSQSEKELQKTQKRMGKDTLKS